MSSELIPLPGRAHELCVNSEVDVQLGTFTEIHRAFAIADNMLYVWNYENETDAVVHREAGQAIRTVALAVPKPYVFPPHVKVCTSNGLDVLRRLL